MFRFLRRLFRLDGPAARTRRSVTPQVEALEDRWMPCTGWNNLGGGMVTPPVATAQTTQPTPPAPVPGTQTETVSASFGPSKTNFTQTQNVAQFNPALGTLTAVQIVQQGTVTSDVQVENKDAEAQTISAQVNGTMTVQVAGATLSTNPTLQQSAALAGSDGSADWSGPDSRDFGPQNATSTNAVMLSASSGANLSGFVGTGSVAVTENAAANASISGPGNLLASACTQGSADVQVIYYYTPTPPPNVPPPIPTPPPCGCEMPPPPDN